MARDHANGSSEVDDDAAHRAALRNATEELAKVRQQLAEAPQRTSAMMEKLRAKLKVHREQSALVQAECERLVIDIEESKRAHLHEKREIEKHLADKDRLAAELIAAQRGPDPADAEVVAPLDELAEFRAKEQRHIDSEKEIRAQVERLEEEIAEAQKAGKNARSKREAAQQEAHKRQQQADGEREAAREQLKEIEERKNKMNQSYQCDLIMAKSRAAEIQEELVAETNSAEAIKKEAEETTANVAALEEKVKELEALRAQEKEKLAELEAKVEETKRECVKAKASAKKVDETSSELDGQQLEDKIRKVHSTGAAALAVLAVIAAVMWNL
eukprot:gnl/MRDRNA2_/MRDRNA2_63288_c0_seq1.p1 gnl/MRDRNA2_/MRDRNA2_63288_c0~~gnl/MRDRNA2_/MRDRNA2_63288_c0_seq1.p1  ORF type:complete len:330 (-),score=125.79 gnl/MRDRNA2_/MRDRNA2_63288_c0_seq1:39-1028(-)